MDNNPEFGSDICIVFAAGPRGSADLVFLSNCVKHRITTTSSKGWHTQKKMKEKEVEEKRREKSKREKREEGDMRRVSRKLGTRRVTQPTDDELFSLSCPISSESLPLSISCAPHGFSTSHLTSATTAVISVAMRLGCSSQTATPQRRNGEKIV